MHVFAFSYVRLFAEALVVSLEQCDGISKVIACHKANQLVEQALQESPDIVLIDVTTEQVLIEARAICEALPKTPIIAISLPENSEKVIACADAGLVGYVPRQASINELLTSMLNALKGECICNPKIAACLLREIRIRQKQTDKIFPTEMLTLRERELLHLIGRGFSNKQIARELQLSVATVKNHIHNIFTKLNVRSRAEVLAFLRNEPWIAKTG